MQPGLYEKMKARADKEGKSFNDFVHALLEKAMENISAGLSSVPSSKKGALLKKLKSRPS